jgi:hypothetical protein
MERIGEDDPEEEDLFRDLWDDETQREVMLWRSSRLTARLGWEDPQVFEICICSLLCVRVGRRRVLHKCVCLYSREILLQ